jgi:APA family basic amino acid/polyamine antiporter
MNDELRRDVDLLLLISIGVGAMVGSGIYTLPGLLASVSGPLSILAVVAMSLITGIFIYVLSELGRIYPKSGGLYYFAKEALGDLPGFITGFSFYVSCFVGTAAIIYSFILYMPLYFPALSNNLTISPLGVALALFLLGIFTLINIFGVKYGAVTNFVLTVLRIVPLIVFIIIALISFKPSNLEPFAPYGFGSMWLSIAFGFWMFVGFESLVLVGEEVKKPAETIKRAAIATLIVVSLVYILVILGFIGAVNWAKLGLKSGNWSSLSSLSAPLADVSRSLGFEWLAMLMVIGAAVSSAGCFSDWVLLQARVAFALSREGHFFRQASLVHPSFKTPHVALILSSILTGLVIFLVPSFPNVVLIAMIAEFVPYAVSALSLAVIKEKKSYKVLGLAGFILGSLYIYWACWPWTLTGTLLAISSLALYILHEHDNKLNELKQTSWYFAYLLGLTVLSLVGDETFTYNNFLPISPLNIFKTPLDILAVSIFATAIYMWALRNGIKRNLRQETLT